MSGAWPPNTEWRRSSVSGGTNCVEMAVVDDRVLVRDSKSPSGPSIAFKKAEWQMFVNMVKEMGAADGDPQDNLRH